MQLTASRRTLAETRYREILEVPLSGEAIRTMNYVDDISVTLRRILATVPVLTPEEKVRVSEYIKNSEPGINSILEALK